MYNQYSDRVSFAIFYSNILLLYGTFIPKILINLWRDNTDDRHLTMNYFYYEIKIISQKIDLFCSILKI